MKAIAYYSYGTPDVLNIVEVAKPVPKDDEVLIKIKAASINSWDWDMVRGKPYLYRLLFGIGKPKYPIVGSDFAGVVEDVGIKVKKFKPGDEVFGDNCEGGFSTFAEYVYVKEKVPELKSAGMTFEQAASIPQAGGMALQALMENYNVTDTTKILLNGAGGGVGTFALQLAKAFGAEVTAVDSVEKLNKLLELGADHVLDYRKTDYTKNGVQFDLVVDVIAQKSMFDYMNAIKPKGIFKIIGGSVGTLIQIGLIAPLYPFKGNKKLNLLGHKPNKYLKDLNKFFEDGKYTPVIDHVYPLDELAIGLERLGKGDVFGKVIIKI